MTLVALALAFAACGGDDESTTSTALATSITTVDPSSSSATTQTPQSTRATTTTTPPTTSPTPPSTSCAGSPSIDADGSLRDQFVTYLSSCGFTPEEAACLFDNLDFADPAVVGGQSGPIVAAFEECGIDQARASEIGG